MHQAVTQKINKSSQILHIEYFGTVWCNRSPAAPLQLGNSLKVRIQMNQCQRHNWPNALSTWTQSTPLVQNRSFNKIWNLGQASAWLVNVRKSYLRKSYLVGLPESISHQEVPPQIVCTICTVIALLDSFVVTNFKKSVLTDHDCTYGKYFLFWPKLSFLIWKQISWHGMVNWFTNCSLWTHTYFQYLFQVSGLFDGWYWGRRIAYSNKIQQEHRLTQWQGKAMQWLDLGPMKYK